MKNMVCKKCGIVLPKGALYCINCNTWQNVKKEGENNKMEKKQNNENQNNKLPSNKNQNNRQEKYLVNGEEIIARAKWSIVPFILIWALIILFEIALMINCNNTIYRIKLNSEYSLVINLKASLITIIIITLFICAISVFLFFIRRELLVTNKKIYGRIGIIGTKQFIIPLNKINYISVRYSIITRILNSAKFIIYSGNSFFGIRFFFVSKANEFKKELEMAIYKETV